MFHHWKLQDFAPREGEVAGVYAEQVDTSDWIDITVPGDVHQALIESGRIEDPFYDRNESACAWMEEREWWYRISFMYDQQPLKHDERLLLTFQGLDTFVTVWLNGEELGRHDNMFREAVFDVTQRLHTDAPNTLALCFHPPLQQAQDAPFESWGPHPARVTMRKAQFGYGWDWGPRLPTIGIWRPVTLQRQHCATLQGMHFSTLKIDTNNNKALVAIHVDVERFAGEQAPDLSIALLSPGSALEKAIVAEHALTLVGSSSQLSADVYMEVENPRLWWTHDLGEPALYTLHVTLHLDGEELEQRQQEVGIRTLQLDQAPDPDEPGTRYFRFVLNDVPLFARGADWIPAHSFVGALTEERYATLLAAVREANMNMLRVWGGGIYEHNVFYELCSQLGLLIWQDFMFACAMYPENNPHFVDEVEAEARYQVQRLRNYACLALWCGNNENQWIHDRIHWNEPAGSLYYDEILPRVVKEVDGQTPYWAGSPYGGNDYNGAEDGDVHNWQVWHGNLPRRFGQEAVTDHTPEGVAYTHYAEDLGRFISEFGMHASPVYETLRRTIPLDQLYHHSASMDHHNKDNPKNKGDHLMMTVTGLPKDLEEYIAYSMIAQAEGLKFGIEHYRRRKPHCSGTLLWQLNDCWPVLSWSILDYYGFGKAGYYYTKRVYAPVLASFKALADGSIELWLTNDTVCAIKDTVIVHMRTFEGCTLWEESRRVEISANASQSVWRWSADMAPTQPNAYLSVRSENALFPANRHFFAAIKDLQRVPAQPEITIMVQGDHELHVRVQATAYVYFLHVLIPDEHTRYSDNYFDLEAGESRVIVVTNQKVTLTREMVSLGWR